MSNCPNPECGNSIPPGESFCPNCGWNVSSTPPQTQAPAADAHSCPKCGRPNPPDARFCETCGEEISAVPTKIGALRFTDNSEIEIGLGTQIFGRVELAKFVPSQAEASWISRRHFFITGDGADFYIQDDGSTNKTTLNGQEITGKGRKALHDGDQIEVAGILTIHFGTK